MFTDIFPGYQVCIIQSSKPLLTEKNNKNPKLKEPCNIPWVTKLKNGRAGLPVPEEPVWGQNPLHLERNCSIWQAAITK
jgi:hypothetical protein